MSSPAAPAAAPDAAPVAEPDAAPVEPGAAPPAPRRGGRKRKQADATQADDAEFAAAAGPVPDSALRTLDLFTGIGGFTYALHGLARPVMYCEVDPNCHKVLRRHMARGALPKAPIHPDVRTMDGEALRGEVDMIVGGFPCVGFSRAGKLQGFEDPQSGLFAQIVRLTRAIQPSFVFMENVPGILRGEAIDHIVAEFAGMGYALWWTVVPAYAVGSPQNRLRWFCLAVKPDKVGTQLHLEPMSKIGGWPRWAREPKKRMIFDKEHGMRRCDMLGNAVIPAQARLAFLALWTGLSMGVGDLRLAKTLTLRLPQALHPFKEGQLREREKRNGGALDPADPRKMVLASLQGLPAKPNLGITLASSNYDMATMRVRDFDRPSTAQDRAIDEAMHLPLWPTPRRRGTCFYGNQTFTRRAARDLASALRFAAETPDDQRGGYVNPDWVEWLMGYPCAWTSLKATR